MEAAVVLAIFTAFSLLNLCSFTTAVGPCEYFDGSGRVEIDLQFTESFGGRDGDHLPTRGEVQRVSRINGRVRPSSSGASAITSETVLLRPWESLSENEFHNGSQFLPLQVYFNWTVEQGVLLFQLKQGLDRELLKIYVPNLPGVTQADKAVILFHIECIPDDSAFPARNFTVRVKVIDVNDNAPLFYNNSLRTNHSMKNFSIAVKEGTPSGVLVLSGVTARDKDEGRNAQAAVFMMRRHSLFELAPNSTEIRLLTKAPVHYEYFGANAKDVAFTLTIFAVDSPINRTERLTSQILIRVTISEEEDPPPLFDIPSCFRYSGRCVRPTYYAEAAGRGISVSPEPIHIEPRPIKAIISRPEYFAIRYSLICSENPPYFRINESTGEVFQLRSIEDQQTITVTVKATKWTDKFNPNFGRSSFALLRVTTELKANDTETAGKFVPMRIHLLIVTLLSAAWILTAALLISFCVFQCWNKRLVRLDGGTQPVRPEEDQGQDGPTLPLRVEEEIFVSSENNSNTQNGGRLYNEHPIENLEASTDSRSDKLISYSPSSSGLNSRNESTSM